MQAAILSHGRIGRENSCFYGRAITVDAPAIKRNAADVFQIEINCIGCNRVQKAIERLLQREFEFSYYTYDFVNSRPVQQTAWSMDQQRNVFVKLDIRRQYHFVHSIDLHSCHSVSLDGLATERCAFHFVGGKMVAQSSFMLTTVQSLATASSHALSSLPTSDSRS